jgi:hypothetical protein
MPLDSLETRAHTTRDGTLHLDLDVGIADVDVTIIVRVVPAVPANVDANGWPVGFFEQVAGSMPQIERGSQGEFEERLPLE